MAALEARRVPLNLKTNTPQQRGEGLAAGVVGALTRLSKNLSGDVRTAAASPESASARG